MAWAWIAIAAGAAALLSLLACICVERFLGVRDAPDNVRKLQAAPVPTSGGLGFALAASAVVLAVQHYAIGGGLGAVAWLIAASTAAMVLGFIDDRWPTPARLKLVALVAIAGFMVALGVRADVMTLLPGLTLVLPVALGAVGSLIWIIVVANAVNFMDGANGLSMGMAAVAATGFAICTGITGQWEVALFAAALAGALVGFLVLNVPGRLFAGDAGALFVGTALAGLGLLLVRQNPHLLFLPPLLLSPFLVDVLLTLLWRAQRKRPLLSPHRDHAYQIALKAGMSHGKVALVHAIWAFNAAAVAVIATLAGGYAPTLTAILLILAGVWMNRVLRKLGETHGLVEEDRKPNA